MEPLEMSATAAAAVTPPPTDELNYRLLPEFSEEYLEKEKKTDDGSFQTPRNLDEFLARVYLYFQRKGFWCIVLYKLVNLLIMALVILLVLFLAAFVDYGELFDKMVIEDAVHVKLSRITVVMWVLLGIFGAFWTMQLGLLVRDAIDKWEIYRFYANELSISETELQTIEWAEVARRILRIPRLCPNLTPLELAQRILRQENYFIAIFNRKKHSVLNLRFPCSNTPFYTKTLEWSLHLAVWSFVFNGSEVKPEIRNASPAQLTDLASRLRRRIIYFGLGTFVLSPLAFAYLVTYYFFRYGEEIRNRPEKLGARNWTRYAQWKFRLFNQLPHAFHDSLNLSLEPANQYVAQFASNVVGNIARFIAFTCGAFFTIIVVLTLIDDDLILGGQLWGKNMLWYLTVLGAGVAISRALIPDPAMVFRPQQYLDKVCDQIKYRPKKWRGRANHPSVYAKFIRLFDYRIVTFLREMASVLLAPFVLLFSLPQSAEAIVRFFHDFTVEYPGVGYVCSFSTFDLGEHGSTKYGAPSDAPKEKKSRNGKLEKSIINFKAAHPDWQPAADGQKLISNLANFLVESTDLTQSAIRSQAPSASQISSLRDPRESLYSMQLSDITRLHESFADSHPDQSIESGLRRGY
jgi:autophagy-related protein 9